MEGFDSTESWGDDDDIWPGYNDGAGGSDTCEINGGQEHCNQTVPSHSSVTDASSNSVSTCIKVTQSSADQIPDGLSQELGSGQQVETRFQHEIEPQLWSSSAHQPQMYQQSKEPPPLTSTLEAKRKRLHMDALDCSDLAQMKTGAMALKNPLMVRTSSKDSNRGLYPRPSRPSQQRTVPTSNPGFSPRVKKHSPNKITLSKEQMKNQRTLDNSFLISPGKKAIPTSSSPQGLHQQSPHQLASSLSYSGAVSSPFPKQNLNSQFTSVNPAQSLAVHTCTESAIQPSSPSSQDRTVTKMYFRPNQNPSPSPAKSARSTVDFDIEDFQNDNSWYGFGVEMAPTPQSSNFIRPSPPSSQECTPTKRSLKSKQSASPAKPAKHTIDSDIEEFQNDNSLDGVDFHQASTPPDCSPSKSVKSTVDSDLEAFDNDCFFDNIDPGFLDAKSIPSQPSSQSCISNPPNTFGLLGEGCTPGCSYSSDEEVSMQGFARLPLEVLERIFCFVPMMNICLHLSLVCKLWNGIISKEDFMPWKKTYHRLRMKSVTDVAEQLNLITHDQEETEDTCLLDLIRNMPKFKARCGSTMDKDLQKHPKYVLAKDIMKYRAPEVLQNEEPNPWSTICLLVVLSETVQDVSCILECLLNRTASCTTMEVLECLYCIAAYLWKYKIRFGLNSGLHYRVYHALYLFENSPSSVALLSEGPSAGLGVPPTHEQWRIINHDIARGKVVKIVAFAGTGKTTTLVKYAERRPNATFLYVAFNRSVMQHAVEIFPRNVSSKTTHSLAYRAIGWEYKRKLDTSLKPSHVHKVLPVGERKELPWLCYASQVCKTLQNFCASADEFITTRHVPANYYTNTQNGDVVVTQRHMLEHRLKMKISNDAASVWEKMIDVKNTEAHITHDVYLKLYQLSKPWHLDYDCLLIDEAQDLTPAQQDILLNQRGAKILVGDPHQQIYSFRGATDAMNRVRSEKTFHLTQSFRFGTEIAYIVNCLMERATNNSAHMQQIMIGKRETGHINGKEIGQLAIITRNNVTLFSEAVKIVEADSTTMLAFVGGIDCYGMDVILDIYQLLQPEDKRGRIKNSYIWAHRNFGALKMYANNTEDGELLGKIRIVDMYNIRIPELVGKIQSRTRQESMADIVLSTAHKAKGLEFDTVKITDDFGISEAKLTPLCVLDRDELNMVYVAVSRAKKSLVLTNSLIKFISGVPSLEKFAYPVPARSSRGHDGEVSSICIECRELIPGDCVVLLRKKALKVAYPSITKQGGILCPQCSIEMYPSFCCFFI